MLGTSCFTIETARSAISPGRVVIVFIPLIFRVHFPGWTLSFFGGDNVHCIPPNNKNVFYDFLRAVSRHANHFLVK
jgi:hypothetical protein